MANKKETKTTKKPVEKKTTTKKTTVKKVEKKVEIKPVEIKKIEKVSFKDRLKKFFNSPQPLIVILAIMVVGLLIYNIQYSKHDTIYVGHYEGDQGTVGTVHCFTNHKINVFYATTATYEGEDKKLYGYQIGYYYEDGEKIADDIQSEILSYLDKLQAIISENSYFNISELSTSKIKFTEEAMKHMDKLHFIVYGATQKDSDVVDFVIDYPIQFDHVV